MTKPLHHPTMIRSLDEVLRAARQITARRVLVAWPANDETFEAIREARETLGIPFILAGDPRAIEVALQDRSGVEILDCNGVDHCLSECVKLLARGEADILLKGGIDSASIMRAVLRPEAGLRTGRLLSDVFVFEYAYGEGTRLVMITDGGVNIEPDLEAKAQLIRNAVEVAHALGNPEPKVAVLAATEFVQLNMPATIDGAILSKMNERGQISGCVVDGPLALDAALDRHAATEKRLRSAVGGAADILLCPNIESANNVAKSTTYIGHARLAHVIVGARIPILIPSRADTSEAKLLSLALGMIMSDHTRAAG